MWSSPDFPLLTTQRYEQVLIGNSADFAYVPVTSARTFVPDGHDVGNGFLNVWVVKNCQSMRANV